MNVHTYEKFWLGASLVLIVGFILTITYGSVGLGIAMIDDSPDDVDPENIDDHPEFSDPGVREVDENQYEVYVQAFQFGYLPNEIEVPAHSTVTFHLTSIDVIHSFSVVGTNANTMIIPGEISTLTVETEDPGEYGILCSEYCGARGHHDMEGLLVVVPQDEFQLEGEQ